VFLSGFTSELSIVDAKGNSGYGSDPDFFGNGRIQPFLQGKFPGSYFLTYIYHGFTSEGKPSPYTCPLATDSNIADLAVGLYSQISQFLRSHPNTQNTNVYVIGHSLGGVIAFSFLSQMIEGKGNLLNSLPNGGVLKGVFTLDAPIGGVSDNGLYVLTSAIRTLTHCSDASFIKQPIVKQLNDLFNSATLPDFRGAAASIDATITLLNQKINETVAFDAMQHGITVSTFANTNDLVWQPNLCTVSLVQDFSITQWLREVKAGRNSQGGAVYARSFTRGPLSCSAVFNKSDPANHFAVLTEPNIQTAIWQVITGGAPNSVHTLTYAPPPKLAVNKSLLHVCDHINSNCPDDCGFGDADGPTDVCHILLSSPSSNPSSIKWAATIQGSGEIYSYLPGPSKGTLTPGQQVDVRVWVEIEPCVSVKVVFTGGTTPVVVPIVCS